MTGGGSGGHVTPILSVARELKSARPDSQLVYIGHKGDKFDSLQLPGGDLDFLAFINGGKFRRYHGEGFLAHLLDFKTLALNARDFFRVITATFAALRILRKVKPDVVFSKGSFVAVPVGLAARLMRIPIVTHDSDAIPGLANRIVGRWALVHATGMPAEVYPYPKAKTVYTGVPINDMIKKVSPRTQARFKKELGVSPQSSVLLVGGAGNGSKTLNDLVLAIAPDLLKDMPGLHIFDVAGRLHDKELKQRYDSVLNQPELDRVHILGFIDDFYKYAAAADIIITRAGATSLSEYAMAGKTCVVIPSPFLAGGHQLKNTDELTRRDAAVVLPNEVRPDELLAVVGELFHNDARRVELASHLHGLAKPGAAKKIADLLLEAAESKRR